MTRPPALAARDIAPFLDIDGTLLALVADPGTVVSDTALKALLKHVDAACGGRLALVSGRSLAEIDRIFAPHRFRAAGGHGGELRFEPDGCIETPGVEPEQFAEAGALLTAFASANPGLLLETKRTGYALHYRARDELGPRCLASIRSRPAHTGRSLHHLVGQKGARSAAW